MGNFLRYLVDLLRRAALSGDERRRLRWEREQRRIIQERIDSGAAQKSIELDIAGNVGAGNADLDRFLGS